MSSWTERMASVVAACGPRPSHPGLPYHRRLEKVKFGVALDQVCKRDIPGPLLVMLLKLNKEGPFKKDVFRAPGHQGNMKKLIHFVQQGRLVNIHSFSVNTIASVMKKFLRKIPGGIFGADNEAELFDMIGMEADAEKLAVCRRVISSLPAYSQHLLVLLFGTFRVIHCNSERAKTGMSAEALGVSVAPSFFHTCVAEGKVARPEEVQKFKSATRITTFFIQHFGMRDLFGRENYEYYARLTGRILKVEDEWIFFTYPPVVFSGPSAPDGDVQSAAAEGPQQQQRLALLQRRDSDPSVVDAEASTVEKTGSLEVIPENCPLDPNGRLSMSLEDQNVSPSSSCGSSRHRHRAHVHGAAAKGAKKDDDDQEEEKSFICLPQVHQRQTERMRHRSEWFLSDPTGMVTVKCRTSGSSSRLSSFGPPPQQQQQQTHLSLPPSAASAPSQWEPTPPPPLGFRPPLSPLLFASAGRPTTTTTSSGFFFASSPSVSKPWSRFPTAAYPSPLASPFSSTFAAAGAEKTCDKASPGGWKPFQQQPEATGSPPASLHQAVVSGNAASNLRLRRRLSDKDKERRLVRRSSSKRKDKENGGGGGGDSGAMSASSRSLDRQVVGSSAAAVAESGPSSLGPDTTSKQPKEPKLKRAGSADAGGGVARAAAAGGHPALCRTASQDAPQAEAAPPRQGGSGSTSPFTRSLPRI